MIKRPTQTSVRIVHMAVLAVAGFAEAKNIVIVTVMPIKAF